MKLLRRVAANRGGHLPGMKRRWEDMPWDERAGIRRKLEASLAAPKAAAPKTSSPDVPTT